MSVDRPPSTVQIHTYIYQQHEGLSYLPLDLWQRNARGLEGVLASVVLEEFHILEAFGDGWLLMKAEPGFAVSLAILVGQLGVSRAVRKILIHIVLKN